MINKNLRVLDFIMFTAIIHRIYLWIGFALKPLYIAIICAYILDYTRTLQLYKVRKNFYYNSVGLFMVTLVFSTLVSGAELTSIRFIFVLIIVLCGCNIIYNKIRSIQDIDYLLDSYTRVGFIIGVFGLIFYAIYFLKPDIVKEGSVFEGVTYDIDRSWVMPSLMSFDVGSNGYAFSLLPFIFAVLGNIFDLNKKKHISRSVGVIVILLLNLFFTFSRGGIISFLLTLIIFVTVSPGNKIFKISFFVVMSLIPIFFSTEIIEIYKEYSILKGAYSGGDEDRLLSDRDELAMQSFDVFLSNPFFGIGIGRIAETSIGKQAHNTYLELLAECGLFVSIMYIFIIVTTFYRFCKLAVNCNYIRSNCSILGLFCGWISLLIASIPTSVITIPILWFQITIVVAIINVCKNKSNRI